MTTKAEEGLISLGSDRPGQIVQIAFATRDLHGAVLQWLSTTRAGPFFLTRFPLGQQCYRGEFHESAALDIAIGYLGDVMIELMAPCDDAPSICREMLETRGEGLHHLMIACADFDAAVEEYVASGWPVAAYSDMPGYGRSAYIDSVATLGHFIELVVLTQQPRNATATMYRAHLTWDGSDPIRDYPQLG